MYKQTGYRLRFSDIMLLFLWCVSVRGSCLRFLLMICGIKIAITWARWAFQTIFSYSHRRRNGASQFRFIGQIKSRKSNEKNKFGFKWKNIHEWMNIQICYDVSLIDELWLLASFYVIRMHVLPLTCSLLANSRECFAPWAFYVVEGAKFSKSKQNLRL